MVTCCMPCMHGWIDEGCSLVNVVTFCTCIEGNGMPCPSSWGATMLAVSEAVFCCELRKR